jgi:hypothetical protein
MPQSKTYLPLLQWLLLLLLLIHALVLQRLVLLRLHHLGASQSQQQRLCEQDLDAVCMLGLVMY